MPPPRCTIDHGDHHELVSASTENPRNVAPVDQVVILDEAGGQNRIRLFPNMTAESLRTRIAALGDNLIDQWFLHADEATYSAYLELLREIRPGVTVTERDGYEAGIHAVKGRVEFTFHEDYWRAIAKIGFHYYLLNAPRGFRGDEPEFAPIRRFIKEGGDRKPFFAVPAARFLLPFGEVPGGHAILPQSWAHVLAADDSYGDAVAMVSLFMGPERLAPTYHINLGRLESPLLLPGNCCAHAYLYYAEPSKGKYAGRVVAQSLTRLR